MDSLITIWWLWIAAALLLGIIEILAPGFIFLGFAIGAGLTGLALVGPLAAAHPYVLLLVFALISLAAWLALRHFFKLPTGQVKTFDSDIND